jgi:hypothetical protein
MNFEFKIPSVKFRVSTKCIIFTVAILVVLQLYFFGQSIFMNPITDANPGLVNPYVNGQIVDSNCALQELEEDPD